MSLVPFAAASPSPASGPAVLSRPGAAARQPAPSGAHAAAARPASHGADSRAGRASKAAGAFEHALQSARQDEAGHSAASEVGPKESTQEAAPREAGEERLQARDEREPQPTAAAAPSEEAAPPVPTSSWLLLALEHGTLTRADVAAPSTETELSVDVPPMPFDAAAVSMTAPALIDPTAAVVPTGSLPQASVAATLATGAAAASTTVAVPTPGSTPPPTTVQPTGQAMGGVTVPEPIAAEAATTEMAAIEGQGTPVPAVPAGLAPETQAPLPPGTDRELVAAALDQGKSGRLESALPSVAAPAETPEPASSRQGGARPPEVEVQLPARDALMASLRSVAPGLSVSRLAQTLGRAGHPDAPLATPALAPVEGATAPPAVANVPTARATEVLMRLAQAAAGLPPRQHEGSAPQAFAPPAAAAGLPPATVEAPSPVAAPLAPAVAEQVGAQLITSLKMQSKDGVGEAKLQLRPDALGNVTVTLKVEQGAVTAVVRAESPQVQEWVLQHQQSLRQQLEGAGLHLDELTVNPDGEQQQRQPSQQDAESDQRRRPTRADDGRLGSEPVRFESLL